MSDDLIKREDAIEAVKEWFKVIELNPDILIDSIISIPSADRPQGEWIKHKNAEEICGTLISNYECSLCHEWQTLISNFCPSCGARMKGVHE